MFDAIAPRYDLVNRIMTFRLDVRWRRRAVRSLGAAARQPRPRPGQRHRRPLRRPAPRRAAARSRSTSASACCGPTAAARRGCRPTSCASRCPTASVDGVTCGFALRNLVDLDAFFAELGRVVRPGGRIALLDVGIPHNRLVRFGNGIYFGKVVPRIGALLSDAAAYRYLPRSVAYLPPPDDDGGDAAPAPGSPTPPTPTSAAASPSCSPAPADARRHPRRRRRHRRPRPQRHRPRRRLPVRARRRRPRRARRRGARAGRARRRRCWPPIDHDDRAGGAATRPGRRRLGAVRPGGRRRADRAGRDACARRADGRRLRDGGRRRRRAARGAATRRARRPRPTRSSR